MKDSSQVLNNLVISLVIPSFYPATVYGGPIFSSLHTCEALSEFNGFEVRVSTTNTNMTSKLEVEKNHWIKFKDDFFVKYYDETVIGKFSLSLFVNIWKDIKKSDVVHIQAIFSTPTPISLIYAKLFGKPVLLSPRGSFCEWGLNQGSKYKKWWLKYLIKPFVKNIYWHATCEAEKVDILNIFPKANVSIVPNGVAVDLFRNYNVKNQYLKKYIGQDIDVSHIIVSMSRLHAKKGFDILIKSFVNILNHYSDSVLLIAGPDEGEKKLLILLTQELKVVHKVFFVDSISGQDKIDFLANADLFVLPSHNENFGNVYIESLAAGTPIVASTGTPWSEVESADCGKWVDNSVEDTAQAMLEMLQKDREQMRVNSMKFSKKYDWKNVAIQFKEIFEGIIK